MPKDKRYSAIKVLIQAGHITSFRQIFDHLPVSLVYKNLGMNYTRFKKLINNTPLFTMAELIRFANLLDMDPKIIIDLSYQQYLDDLKTKKKK